MPERSSFRYLGGFPVDGVYSRPHRKHYFSFVFCVSLCASFVRLCMRAMFSMLSQHVTYIRALKGGCVRTYPGLSPSLLEAETGRPQPHNVMISVDAWSARAM